MDGDLPDEEMRTLCAFYDLKIGPVSFDVVPFLIRARMAAQDAGCDRLHVVIVPDERGLGGMFRDKSHLYDAHEMDWRLWNLVIPACRLAGASVTLADSWEQAKRLRTEHVFPSDWDRQTLQDKAYLPRPIVDAARQGRKIPRLKASEHARRKIEKQYRDRAGPLGVVTLTYRNTYEPERNTNRAIWDEVLLRVIARGFGVVAIVDTDEALNTGAGQPSINLDLRMAWYERADLNLIGNGGPVVTLFFSEAAYTLFGAAQPLKSWRKFWEAHIGLDVGAGEQLPWARDDQRLVYEPPSVEAMMREFEGWEFRRKRAALGTG